MTPDFQTTAHRRPTREVRVGSLTIGGRHPILIQSMTIADTMDSDAVVAEIRGLVDAGCPLVRVTAPHVPAAENLREIKRRLRADKIEVPLVADIHFTPNAALIAAEIVEKVRINPGNYADRKRFATREYSDQEYASELERLRDAFRPLVLRCKETGAAMRIGTNHGSLSDRIMNRYGDTPLGMVESALEFVRIAEAEGYRDIVLSMKSSIPSVMIAAYRLLAERMDELGMDYPLHLGVTEAGDGLAGRIKSATGIGSLLVDGLGDTIRVSLTEDSVHELPAARAILDAVAREQAAQSVVDAPRIELPTEPTRARRATAPWMLRGLMLGGGAPVRVEQRITIDATGAAFSAIDRESLGQEGGAEFLSIAGHPEATGLERLNELRRGVGDVPLVLHAPLDPEWLRERLAAVDAVDLSIGARDFAVEAAALRDIAAMLVAARKPARLRLTSDAALTCAPALASCCRDAGLNALGFVLPDGPRWIERLRFLARSIAREDLLFLEAPLEGAVAGIVIGGALTDGMGDAICLLPTGATGWPASARRWREEPVASAYAILQATRQRLTQAEFIACPSCGRTMFDLQSTTAKIQARTGHLKGVKIAVMGCIVNGPGEMADADFGYVGSGPQKIDLYVGKERVRQGVPEAEAEDRLIELIQAHGRWIEPAATGRGASA